MDCIGKATEIFDNAVFVGLWYDDSGYIPLFQHFCKSIEIGHSLFLRYYVGLYAMEFRISPDHVHNPLG